MFDYYVISTGIYAWDCSIKTDTLKNQAPLAHIHLNDQQGCVCEMQGVPSSRKRKASMEPLHVNKNISVNHDSWKKSFMNQGESRVLRNSSNLFKRNLGFILGISLSLLNWTDEQAWLTLPFKFLLKLSLLPTLLCYIFVYLFTISQKIVSCMQ